MSKSSILVPALRPSSSPVELPIWSPRVTVDETVRSVMPLLRLER